MDPAGIELTTSRLRQLRQLPVVQHVRFTPLKSRQKTQLQWRARGCTGQLTTCLECTWCQFQHLCVLILNCALALAIYIFVGLILMLWHRETHINPQRYIYIYIYTHTYTHTYTRARARARTHTHTHTHARTHTHTHIHIHGRVEVACIAGVKYTPAKSSLLNTDQLIANKPLQWKPSHPSQVNALGAGVN